MTTRINGGIRRGIYVEQEVRFVRLDFTDSLGAIGADNAFSSDFNVPNSILEHAVELVAGRATVLGVGGPSDVVADTSSSYVLMLGYAQGHSSAANTGVILSGVTVSGLDSDGATVSASLTATFAKFEDLPVVAAADMTLSPDGKYRPVLDY